MTEPQPYPSIKQGFILVLVSVIASLVVSMLISVINTQFNIDEEEYHGLISLIEYIATGVTIIVIAFTHRTRSGVNERIGLKPFPFPFFFVGFILIICMDYLLDPVTNLIPIPAWFEELMEKELLGEDVFTFIGTVIAAPVLEEILMRGIILDGFLKRYAPQKAIVWSAILFGVMHLNPWQAISAFAIGLLLGVLYWKTKSLWLCILLHVANNGTIYLLASLSGLEDYDTLSGYLGMTRYILGYFIALLVLAVCVYYFYKRLWQGGAQEKELQL